MLLPALCCFNLTSRTIPSTCFGCEYYAGIVCSTCSIRLRLCLCHNRQLWEIRGRKHPPGRPEGQLRASGILGVWAAPEGWCLGCLEGLVMPSSGVNSLCATEVGVGSAVRSDKSDSKDLRSLYFVWGACEWRGLAIARDCILGNQKARPPRLQGQSDFFSVFGNRLVLFELRGTRT